MFNYPVEKHGIRFYKYKFEGVKKPIIIEAFNKLEARRKLFLALDQFPNLRDVKIIDESVSLPLFGITTKNIEGIENVWVGSITFSGWMPIEEFEKLNYDY